ncbi:zinc ribbon domain-containing protein [Streptomyces sp. NPDC056254]|uniref:zinc ribbon domain-containing protein n=1 Tax=Streptomyces sp. NPDC056254 TaxID=3345763 RepID=UPI0035E15EC8
MKVTPAYTSQRCSACGFEPDGDRESQVVFRYKAPDCRHTDHADAAKHIRHAGGHSAPAGPRGRSSRTTGQAPEAITVP